MTTAKKKAPKTAPKTAAAKKAVAKKAVAKNPVAKKDLSASRKVEADIDDLQIEIEIDIDIDDIELDIDIDDLDIDDLDIDDLNDLEAVALVPGVGDDTVSEDALDDAEELSDEDDLDGLLQAEDGADDADVVRERAANTALVAGFDDERVPVKPRAGTVDDEDDDEIDLAVVVERQSYEFVCQSCFLVMRRTQLGQSTPVELCKDCC